MTIHERALRDSLKALLANPRNDSRGNRHAGDIRRGRAYWRTQDPQTERGWAAVNLANAAHYRRRMAAAGTVDPIDLLAAKAQLATVRHLRDTAWHRLP
jgi:hypothetical protein